MLLHQLGTAHVHAMKCFEMSMGFNLPGHGLPTVEQVRLLNAATRLMDVYQNGVLVHHKVRHGATQTVIVKQQVQQVQVNDCGQAVVAATVRRANGPGDEGTRVQRDAGLEGVRQRQGVGRCGIRCSNHPCSPETKMGLSDAAHRA